jgi:hypothetical protein
MDLSNPIVLSMMRQFLTSAGAALITSGYLTAGQWEQVVGGALVLVSVGWSYFKKPPAPKPVPVAVKK